MTDLIVCAAQPRIILIIKSGRSCGGTGMCRPRLDLRLRAQNLETSLPRLFKKPEELSRIFVHPCEDAAYSRGGIAGAGYVGFVAAGSGAGNAYQVIDLVVKGLLVGFGPIGRREHVLDFARNLVTLVNFKDLVDFQNLVVDRARKRRA